MGRTTEYAGYGRPNTVTYEAYPVANARGVATGGISVYIPPKISNRFVHVWDINTCFEIAMTSYNVYPPPQ